MEMTREERTKLIKHLKYARSIGADYSITDKDVDEIIKALEQEPKTGHWIDREIYDADRWKCSECGRTEPYKENYCPNCGAKMVEPQEVRDK